MNRDRLRIDRELAEVVWRRVYTGSKLKRWFWYFVYGHDVSCHAEMVVLFEDEEDDL